VAMAAFATYAVADALKLEVDKWTE